MSDQNGSEGADKARADAGVKEIVSKISRAVKGFRFSILGVTVYALVGKSGTGKSFRAKLLADKYDVDIIVDDGLLIRDEHIVAGKTAKNEKFFLDAVKAALFEDASHCQDALHYLETHKFKRILILGTSDKMVMKIAARLNLPEIFKIIYIEDICTLEEIAIARKSRGEGKHVIPVPSIEIQRSAAHLFYDTIRVFFIKKAFLGRKTGMMSEKTVVRPRFNDGAGAQSSAGDLTISEAAVSQMVLHCMQEFMPEIKPLKIKLRSDGGVSYVIKLSVSAPYKSGGAEKIHALQKYIAENIEKYTGVMLKEVHISIDRITN